ncbi:endoglucanase 17-like [Cryptomeria japonica]|uniref:endoglucanase 17-like n=1 Tax=Cryptomeria japonica TaxID=3369 RepID=UPI0027DA86A3|nr:endoglucanase 17-like [Cryptomeria japonica]
MRSFFSMLVKANYTFLRVSSHHHQLSIISYNYREALSNTILFFEGQNFGKLPVNQCIEWRRYFGLSNGAFAHVNVTGGYYDAGDNVKFIFSMAFTTTMLSWSVLEFGGFMSSDISNAKTAICSATYYHLRAIAHPDTIYV